MLRTVSARDLNKQAEAEGCFPVPVPQGSFPVPVPQGNRHQDKEVSLQALKERVAKLAVRTEQHLETRRPAPLQKLKKLESQPVAQPMVFEMTYTPLSEVPSHLVDASVSRPRSLCGTPKIFDESPVPTPPPFS